MKDGWFLTALGEVLMERRETPSEEDLSLGRVRILEKISFDSGRIQLREDGRTKTGMILVHPGDLVVSGINAAKGAIAVYDPAAAGPIAATIHYGAYIANPDRTDVRFLWWLLRSRTFQRLLREYLPGGIKTELKAKHLLPIPVPLPSVLEQRKIVDRIEALDGQIAEARTLRLSAVAEGDKVIGAALRYYSAQIEPFGALADVLVSPPRNGWSARCDNLDGGVSVLSLGAVTGFRYRGSEHKLTSLHTEPGAYYWLTSGDILITRSNTLQLLGHAAIYDGHPAPCIYPDLMMRLEPDEARVERRFLWYWLQSPIVRDFVTERAKGTSPTMKKISQGTVMEIPFPVKVSRQDQRRIVAHLDALQAELDALKCLQAETANELDALLSSILDRALTGGF